MKILNQTHHEYLEGKHQCLKKQSLIYLLIALGVMAVFFILKQFLCLIIALIFFSLGIAKLGKANDYKKGIDGEKAVINRLQELDDSWLLINDVKIIKRGGNIDHILLSPKGVFVLETKNYEGSIRCYQDDWSKKRRHRKKFIPGYFPIRSISKQVKSEAFSLRRLIKIKAKLDIPVIPICVFANPEVKLKLIKPTIIVLKIKDLVKWLQKFRAPRILSEQEINLISKCILEKTKGNN